MVHLAHFRSSKPDGKADIDRARSMLRAMSIAYFPLDTCTALVASPHSSSSLSDYLSEKFPELDILVVRQRNSWKCFGQKDLSKWLKEISDEF